MLLYPPFALLARFCLSAARKLSQWCTVCDRAMHWHIHLDLLSLIPQLDYVDAIHENCPPAQVRPDRSTRPARVARCQSECLQQTQLYALLALRCLVTTRAPRHSVPLRCNTPVHASSPDTQDTVDWKGHW